MKAFNHEKQKSFCDNITNGESIYKTKEEQNNSENQYHKNNKNANNNNPKTTRKSSKYR